MPISMKKAVKGIAKGAAMGGLFRKLPNKPFSLFPKYPTTMPKRKPPVQGGPSGISMPVLQGSSPTLQGSMIDPMKMKKPRKMRPTKLMKYL